MSTAREAAATLALGIATTIFDALFVPPALATTVRNRDRREVPGRRGVGAEHDEQRGR
jgi:hypothetical protein